VVARQSRSKPGDSSLHSEQAPQSKADKRDCHVCVPERTSACRHAGVAMATFDDLKCNLFYAPGNKKVVKQFWMAYLQQDQLFPQRQDRMERKVNVFSVLQ